MARLRLTVARLEQRAPAIAAALADVHADRFSRQEREWMDRIEELRARLLESDEAVEAVDYPGVGRERDYSSPYLKPQTLGETTRYAATKPPWCRFMFKVVLHVAPYHVLELGTHVGIGTAYMAAAIFQRGHGRLVTLEGSPALSEIARRNFAELGLDPLVEVRTGLFDETLAPTLAESEYDVAYIDGHHDRDATLRYHEQIVSRLRSVALYDDITYSTGMSEAWARVRQDPRFSASLTLPQMGVCALGSRRTVHARSWLP